MSFSVSPTALSLLQEQPQEESDMPLSTHTLSVSLRIGACGMLDFLSTRAPQDERHTQLQKCCKHPALSWRPSSSSSQLKRAY